LDGQIYAEFPNSNRELSDLIGELLNEQLNSWPRLAKAYRSLSQVRVRPVSLSCYAVILQFNPQRAPSSGAAVDEESIKKRPCFLCTDNLPAQQKGILYKNDYLILCNPAPVEERHLTITLRQHLPQSIVRSCPAFLDLAFELGAGYTVLYNGPACGASAPDHLHFQALPADILPLEKSFLSHFSIIRKNPAQIFKAESIDRSAIALSGKDRDTLREQFSRLLLVAQKTIPQTGEPMLNALCTYRSGEWRLIIFLRSRHRPEAFFATDEKRIFVSPGAIDLAGLIITPQMNNFQSLDAAQIAGIYREVSISAEALNRITQDL